MINLIYERVLRRLIKESGGPPDLSGLAVYANTTGNPTAIIYSHPIVTANIPGAPDQSGKPIWQKSEIFMGTRVVKGIVILQEPPGPCDGAFQTRFTVGPGLGKLVYGLGYALSPTGKLMASREKDNRGAAKVTPAAQGGWSKTFAKKTQVGRWLDDMELPLDQRRTPDDLTDDCELQEPKSLDNNPMNYSFVAAGWEIGALRELEAAHNQVMAEIPQEFQKAFIANLQIGANFFWKNNYDGSAS